MSLESRDEGGVPELTARVVRASFPKGTLAVRAREALGPLFSDGSFAEAFSARGRPAVSPGGGLALVSVLQYARGLAMRPCGVIISDAALLDRLPVQPTLGGYSAVSPPDEALLEPVLAQHLAQAAGYSRFASIVSSARSTVWRLVIISAFCVFVGRGVCQRAAWCRRMLRRRQVSRIRRISTAGSSVRTASLRAFTSVRATDPDSLPVPGRLVRGRWVERGGYGPPGLPMRSRDAPRGVRVCSTEAALRRVLIRPASRRAVVC